VNRYILTFTMLEGGQQVTAVTRPAPLSNRALRKLLRDAYKGRVITVISEEEIYVVYCKHLLCFKVRETEA
jgi:hypothetical protein